MTRWLSDTEQRAWRGYLKMRALLDLQVARDLTREGLSRADYMILSNVSEAPERRIRASELAQRILWTQTRLSHQISRMQARGLVRREQLPGSRATYICLTDEGWAAIEQAAPMHVESVRQHFLDHFTQEQLAVLIDVTERVIEEITSNCEDSCQGKCN